MRILIRKTEAKQNRVEPKELLELHYDRNRTSFSLIERLLAESFFQRCNGSSDSGAVNRRYRRLAAVQAVHSDLHSPGCKFLEMSFKQPGNLARLLIGDQTPGNLGMGFRRQHRLGTFTGKTTPDAVTFKRRASPEAFQRAVAFFAVELAHSQLLCVLSVVPWQLRECSAFFLREFADITVKARNCHSTVFIVELGNDLCQSLNRVVDRTTERARV